MQWLKTLLGQKQNQAITPEARGSNCAHLILLPTWSTPEDMGKEEKATGYRCDACGAALTLDEARERRSL